MSNLTTSEWFCSSTMPDPIDANKLIDINVKYLEYCVERDKYALEHNLKLYFYYDHGVNSILSYPKYVYFNVINGNFYSVMQNSDDKAVFNIFQGEGILSRFAISFDEYFVDPNKTK